MLRRLPALLLALIALLPAHTGRADIIDDYWYLVEMQGKKCGHMHAWTVKDGNQFTTHSELSMSIKRGESVLPIKLSSRFTETAEGKPVKMRSEIKLGAMPTISEYTFKPDGVDVIRITAGVRQPENQPLPEGEWCTPIALGKHVSARIAAGDKEITSRSLEPSVGLKPFTQTMKLIDKVPLEVVGKTVPALKWSSTNDVVPGVESTEFTDEKGVPLRSESDIGGIKVNFIRADRLVALAKADPPELLESTFIRPDKAIKSPRDAITGEYTLTCSGALVGDWPSIGNQTCTKIDDLTAKVTIDTARRTPAPAEDAAAAEFRRPSAMINSEDAEVIKLKTRALKGHEKDSPAARAEVLRTFVFNHINKKSFDVGFASAAETARTQCGDCSEHAVLLAALLRADGIPARCVSGLAYVEGTGSTTTKPDKGFFGYHMWAQALLPAEGSEKDAHNWIDLDAALSPDHPTDATHIAIKHTSLADGDTINAFMDIVPTLGKLKIKVVEVK